MNTCQNAASGLTVDDEALRDLVSHTTDALHERLLGGVACRELDVNAFFPELGTPDESSLAHCRGCPVRLPCLALALRHETSAQRHGWYGGLGPDERGATAVRLGIEAAASPEAGLSDRALRVVRLREQGRTVPQIAAELRVDKRTVYRDLRQTA
ncbi:WhiB family transcriptional regulator [Nocardiopsis dassonvillei]